MGKIIRNGIEYGGTYDSATSVNYDNSVSGLNARTVQEGIDELNNSLEWKLAGTANALKQPISLPTTFNELNIITRFLVSTSGTTERNYTFSILYCQLKDELQTFTNGAGAENKGYYSNIYVSKTEASLQTANDGDVTPTNILVEVYYR